MPWLITLGAYCNVEKRCTRAAVLGEHFNTGMAVHLFVSIVPFVSVSQVWPIVPIFNSFTVCIVSPFPVFSCFPVFRDFPVFHVFRFSGSPNCPVFPVFPVVVLCCSWFSCVPPFSCSPVFLPPPQINPLQPMRGYPQRPGLFKHWNTSYILDHWQSRMSVTRMQYSQPRAL